MLKKILLSTFISAIVFFSLNFVSLAAPRDIIHDLYHVHGPHCSNENTYCYIPDNRPIGTFYVIQTPTEWDRECYLVMAVNPSYNADLSNLDYLVDGKPLKSNTYIVMRNGDYTVTPILPDDLICDPITISITNIDRLMPDIRSVECIYSEDSSYVTVTVTAEDTPDEYNGSSGLDEYAYSFDGGKSWTDQNTFTIKENGEYRVIVRDSVHNHASYYFEIENIKPTSPSKPAEPTISPQKPTPEVTNDEEAVQDLPSDDESEKDDHSEDGNDEDDLDEDKTPDETDEDILEAVTLSAPSPSPVTKEVKVSDLKPAPTLKTLPSPSPVSAAAKPKPKKDTDSENRLDRETIIRENELPLTAKPLDQYESDSNAEKSFSYKEKTGIANQAVLITAGSSVVVMIILIMLLWIMRGRVIIYAYEGGRKYKFLDLHDISLTNDRFEVNLNEKLISRCETGRLRLRFSPIFSLMNKNTDVFVCLPKEQCHIIKPSFNACLELKL